MPDRRTRRVGDRGNPLPFPRYGQGGGRLGCDGHHIMFDSGRTVIWGGVKSLIAGVLFSHAFSAELKAMSIMNEAVQDRVAEGGVTMMSCNVPRGFGW